MAWTEERVDTLKILWNEGLSASQIAGQLGGVTRNAVIGKVHRLGLSGRAAPAKPKAVEPKAAPARAPVRERPAPIEQGFGLAKPTVSSIGTNECKWPIGDPASEDFHFCGQSAAGGKPYCAYHSQLAFQPSRERRERPRKAAPALAAPLRAVR